VKKVFLLFVAVAVLPYALKSQTPIEFTNRVETLTNTAGKVFQDVMLHRATVDYMVYQSGQAVGMIPLHTLNVETVSRLGIDTNWVAMSEARAKKMSQAWAQYEQAKKDLIEAQKRHAWEQAQEQQRKLDNFYSLLAQQRRENPPITVQIQKRGLPGFTIGPSR
jgi:hypothetical protein